MLAIDIKLRHDPDFPQQHLMNALYAKLHRALAADGKGTIGVSFPKHDSARPSLGTVLRLHGTGGDLAALLATPWLTGMRDHVDISELRATPHEAMHRVVRRVQAKSSVDRLRRRAMQRHSIDADEAARRIPESAAESLSLPHVMLQSKSTGQPVFPLFIEHGPLRTSPSSGRFNSYGLSTVATVPWFE